MLSEKAIKEFQSLYKEKYNKELSWKEAAEAANNFFNFFRTLWRIDERLKKELKEERKDSVKD